MYFNICTIYIKCIIINKKKVFIVNTVQPIREREKIEEMKEELKKGGTRDYMLFYTGINSGIRISDIVSLNRDNIRNIDGTMKTHITIVEKKTNKVKKFPLTGSFYYEMERYTKNMKVFSMVK